MTLKLPDGADGQALLALASGLLAAICAYVQAVSGSYRLSVVFGSYLVWMIVQIWQWWEKRR